MIQYTSQKDSLKLQISPSHQPTRSIVFHIVILYATLPVSIVFKHILPDFIIFLLSLPTLSIVTAFIRKLYAPLTWDMIHLNRSHMSSCILHNHEPYYIKKINLFLKNTLSSRAPNLSKLILSDQSTTYFYLKDLTSLTISSEQPSYTDNYFINLLWKYPSMYENGFNIILTFSDQTVIQGWCVFPNVKKRTDIIKVAAQMSQIADIKMGHVIENTPYTFVIKFSRTTTHDFITSHDLSSDRVIEVDAYLSQSTGTSTEDSSDHDTSYQQDRLVTDDWNPRRDFFAPYLLKSNADEIIYERASILRKKLTTAIITYILPMAILANVFKLSSDGLLLFGIPFALALYTYHWSYWKDGYYGVIRTHILWKELICIQTRGGKEYTYHLKQASSVQVKLTRHRYGSRRLSRRGAGRKGSSKTNYNGTISLKGISDTETLMLAETGEAESYHAIYHSAFAFAHIFSNLLDIEVEFIDKT